MLRIKRDSAAQQEYVPLKRVSVEANIRFFAADVTIKQVFRNDEATPIEAVYCFPIEEQAAVYAFVARIDDREIVAQLKEKKEAQKEYSDALRQGHGAYLLEQDEKSQDNFIINVGALAAGKECHISISYVSELDLGQNGSIIRFVVPTTIAPRYNPDKGGISSPAGTTSKYVQTSPYTIEFRCRVDKVGISRVSSTSHPIQVELSQEDAYVIELAQQSTHLDRDIFVDIELAQNHSNTIVAVEPGAVMASFTPSEEDCRRAMNNSETTNEFIFVVDCSGSMADENKIGLARQAMLLFLKSLPVDCHFNIIRFGSNHEPLFKDSTVVYNEQNAQKAEQLTNLMRADLGGTELLRPLQWLEEHPPRQGCARQIFLLTDGEISNVNEVLDLCRSMATSTRIFSFGLGHSPSRSLVKGLARATNGRFVFIPPNSSVDVHVGEQLQRALQSGIPNVQVKWNLGTLVTSVPTKTPPVYVNDRLIIYALADDQTAIFDHNSTVELYADNDRLGEAKVNRVPNVSIDGTIGRLAAKALILELQHSKLPSSVKKNIPGSMQTRFQEHHQPSTTTTSDTKETTKKRIIELSLKHKILSPHTAFIGVEKRDNTTNDDMVLREVPIQISADDQPQQTSHFTHHHAAQMSMMMNYQMPHGSVPMSYARSAASNMSASCWSSRGLSAQSTMYSRAHLMADDDDEECGVESDEECGVESDEECGVESDEECGVESDEECGVESDEEYKESCAGALKLPTSARTGKASTDSDEEEQKHMKSKKSKKEEETWPTGDQNIVRYLINKQKFDGLWDLDAKNIEQLTGKPLANFPQSENPQILVSAIVVVALETRFASLSTMWHGVVQKARKRLLVLLGKDNKKLDLFLESIRQQL